MCSAPPWRSESAGSQFDPDVVDVFCAAMAERVGRLAV
jgi:hypothetical protein